MTLLALVCSPLAFSQTQPAPAPEQKKEAEPSAKGVVEILSDTQGVDFGPYLQRALHGIKTHWYASIPEVARPPVMKSGIAVIQFSILKNVIISK